MEPDFPGAAIILGYQIDVVRGRRLSLQRTLGQIGICAGINDATTTFETITTISFAFASLVAATFAAVCRRRGTPMPSLSIGLDE